MSRAAGAITIVRDSGPNGLGVQVDMHGLGRLESMFKQFSGPIQKKIMVRAIKDGLEDVRDSAKASAPKHSGKMADAIKVRFRTKPRLGLIEGRVAVVGKFAPLAHLVEYGRQGFTANRPFRDKRGHFRSNTTGGGRIASMLFGNREANFASTQAQRFMTRAYLKHGKHIPRRVMRGIARGIRKAARGQRI